MQRTDYDELRTEHYDRRAKVQDLEKENEELKLALGIAASFPAKVRMECKKRIDSKLVSLDFITMLHDSANRVINESAAQHLADIKADAVMGLMDNEYSCETPNGDIAFSSRAIEEYANKLRGESK